MNSTPPEPDIEIVVAEDAGARLATYARRSRWPRALLVMDVNTEAAAGREFARELTAAGVEYDEHVFAQREGLLASNDEVAAVRARIRDDALPVAIGSGVITDVVRYGAHLSGRDFVSVPTAASMDGYASNVAALQVDGVKITYPARAPRAIFADPRVAAAAPLVLTRAGVGDLLAKATARVDWLAAHLLYGEPFSEAACARLLEPMSFAAAQTERLMSGDADAVRGLLTGLLQSGIAMAIVGSSRPASGCEHHASHFWDLLAARGLREHASHGLQVGYATRFAIRLQRFAFGGALAELRRPLPVDDPLGPDAREWLGEPSAEIVAAVQQKQRFSAAVPDSWPEGASAWTTLRSKLAPAIAQFATVERSLDRAAVPARPGYLEIDARTLVATFRFASRLRARYTVIDFLEGQRALEPALAEMLAGATSAPEGSLGSVRAG